MGSFDSIPLESVVTPTDYLRVYRSGSPSPTAHVSLDAIRGENVKNAVSDYAWDTSIADNTTAIQDAFDGAGSEWHVLYIPPGLYTYTGQINITLKNQAMLVGLGTADTSHAAGATSVTLKYTGTDTQTAFVIDSFRAGQFHNINFETATALTGSNWLIDMQGGSGAAKYHPLRIGFYGCSFNGNNPVTCQGVLCSGNTNLEQMRFRDCFFNDFETAVRTEAANQHNFIWDGCSFNDCTIGIEAVLGANFLITGCIFILCKTGILKTGIAHGITVTNCGFENCKQYYRTPETTDGGAWAQTITNNKFSMGAEAGYIPTADTPVLIVNQCGVLVLEGNTFSTLHDASQLMKITVEHAFAGISLAARINNNIFPDVDCFSTSVNWQAPQDFVSGVTGGTHLDWSSNLVRSGGASSGTTQPMDCPSHYNISDPPGFYPITETTTARTLSLKDNKTFIVCNNASDTTITIDPDATLDLPLGFRFKASRGGGGNVDIAGAGPPTVSGTKLTATLLDILECTKISANSWLCTLTSP